MEKDPTSYSMITYLWVIGLSAWGGIAGYIRRVRSKSKAAFSLAEVVGEVCISGFVGMLTFYLCESAKIPQILEAAFIGISGHMGSRSLFFMEALLKRKVAGWLGEDLDEL